MTGFSSTDVIRRLWPVVALLPLSIGGCDNDSEPEPIPSPEQLELYDTDVVARIGSRVGPEPAYTFQRITDASLINDDRIAVADASREIAVFNSTGRHLTTISRVGDGPGEYRYVSRLLTTGSDELLVLDAGRRRVVRYAPDGSLLSYNRVGWVNMDLVGGAAVRPDGEVIALTQAVPRLDAPVVTSERIPVSVVVLGEPDQVDTIATLLGRWRVFKGGEIYFLPFSPTARLASWDGGAAVFEGDTGEIEFLSDRGRRVASFDTRRFGEPLRRSVIDRWIAERRAFFSSRGITDPDAIYPFDVEPDWPDTLPVYSRLVAHDGRCVWAQHYQPFDDHPVRFDVIHVEKGWVGVVTTPRGWHLTDVRKDRATAISRDELDVDQLLVVRIDLSGLDSCGDGAD